MRPAPVHPFLPYGRILGQKLDNYNTKRVFSCIPTLLWLGHGAIVLFEIGTMNLKDEAYKLLKNNRQETDGHIYTLPSPSTYPYQWFWDSCFHAIVLAKLDPEAAKAELRSLVSKQFENGLIPHIIYWQPSDSHRYDWGKPDTSSITQPPLIAYAVWHIYNQDNDLNFLKEMYEPLLKYYNYLIDNRDLHKHNLLSIINPDESGEDNSPRFDEVLGLPADVSMGDHLKRREKLIEDFKKCYFDTETCMRQYFWVKDVPFNAIMIEGLRALGHIASRLGKEEDEQFCEHEVNLIKEAMTQYMYEDGVYWSVKGLDYAKLKVATWAIFAPLFAGLYEPEEAKLLVDNQLMNNDTFLASCGIRTTAKSEPSYRAEGYWRGPVWIGIHWFIYKGLIRYGFEEKAEILRQASIKLIETEGFREYFNPETGIGLGAKNFTWGTLILDMEPPK